MRAQSYPCEVLVVENGSKDDTAAIARLAGTLARAARAQLEEAGKGIAVKTGMLSARGACRYMADTDLSVPLEEIPRFLEAIRLARRSPSARARLRAPKGLANRSIGIGAGGFSSLLERLVGSAGDTGYAVRLQMLQRPRLPRRSFHCRP